MIKFDQTLEHDEAEAACVEGPNPAAYPSLVNGRLVYLETQAKGIAVVAALGIVRFLIYVVMLNHASELDTRKRR